MERSGKACEGGPALSIHRTFVVQLAAVPGTALAGTVEHVVSGRSRRFSGSRELLAFLRRPGAEEPAPRREEGAPCG